MSGQTNQDYESNQDYLGAWWGRPLLRRVDQVCVAVLLASSLLVITGMWLHRGGHRGRLVDIERAPPRVVDFKLDVNESDWPEWTLLPGIGEMLARRIVESRREDGPFAKHEDLLRVKGIGPKTLQAMQPYLLPVDQPQAVEGNAES